MKKPFYIAFIAAFLAVCLLPTAALLCGYKAENRENRPLAGSLPFGAGWAEPFLPADFDAYFEDHFGFREEMVTAFHSLTMALFGDTLNEKVIVGKNDMLFYSETLDDYLGRNLLSDGEIARIAACLRIEQEYCKAQGMSFTFAIAPNKNTVYPENMPARLIPTGEPGNRERLYAALAEAGVPTVDFASLLLSRKGEGQLYHDRDTHWNERGALIAYNAVMERILAGAEYETYASLVPETVCDDAGDSITSCPALSGSPPGRIRHHRGFLPMMRNAPGTGTRLRHMSDARVSLHLFRIRSQRAFPLFPQTSGALSTARSSPIITRCSMKKTPMRCSSSLWNATSKTCSSGRSSRLERSNVRMPNRRRCSTAHAIWRSGYTQLAGCFDAAAQPERIYVLLAQGGELHCFEAFPILEERAESLAGDMASPRGFSLTLPDTLSGEYEAAILANGMRYDAGMVVLENG